MRTSVGRYVELVEGVLDVRDGASRYMGVDLRGFGAGVSEDGLDDPQVRATFQEVGGIAVPNGVDGLELLDSGFEACDPEELLDALGRVLAAGGSPEEKDLDQAPHRLVLEVVDAGQDVGHFFQADHGG